MSSACVCEPVSECVRRGWGREPWGFFNLHFSNSFLLCSPKRLHAERNKHLTFVKGWWSGPDRQNARWQVGGSSKQEFKLHLFLFQSIKWRKGKGGGQQNRGAPQASI